MGAVPVRLSRAARWTLVVLLLLTAGAAAALYYVARESSVLRDRVIAALNGRFESEVALDTLKVTAFPKPGITGTKLELKQNGRPGSPPLIAIREFTGTAGL